MAQSIRDQIRAATLGAKPQFKTKEIELGDTTIEVRQPNLKDRKQLLERAKGADGSLSMMDFTLWSVILCSYAPGTNEKVFSPEDYDSMMEMNTGGFIEKLASAVSELMNEDNTDQKKS